MSLQRKIEHLGATLEYKLDNAEERLKAKIKLGKDYRLEFEELDFLLTVDDLYVQYYLQPKGIKSINRNRIEKLYQDVLLGKV